MYNTIMVFEWDESKRDSNLQKHGVDFVDAVKIFALTVVEQPDTREAYGEHRLVTIGTWDTDYFVVVSTWPGERRRIISAWRAGRDEKSTYHRNYP